MRRTLTLLALLAATAPATAAAATPPDLVLHGGTVWTGDRGTPVEQAVAITGDRITAVGDDRVVRALAGPSTKEVDLHGGFVAPGFTDGHVHTLEQGATGTLEPEWSGYNPAAAEAIRAAIYGYHASNAASGSTPEDGCSDSGLTEEGKAAILRDQELLLSQGLTTTVEAGLNDIGTLRALDALQREGKLRHRFMVRVGWGCLQQSIDAGYGPGWGGPWAAVVGMKLYSDGWLGPRSAALRAPYSDRPGSTGFLFLGDDRAKADVTAARGAGFNLTTHAIGDRGLDTMLRAYEAVGIGPADRAQVEHAQVLAPDLIVRMARLGVIASIQLSFATTDMRFADSALGAERAADAYAWRDLLDAGVRLSGSSDYPVEEINPLWGVQRIVTRQEFDGTGGKDGWHPEQRLTVDEALRLLTADGAYARREEGERGTLTPGRAADLVVLREDPRRLPADCIAGSTVLLTMVNGVVSFAGEQAYPPGDASCPSGAAPAKGTALAITAAAPPAAGTSTSAKKRRGRALRSVRLVRSGSRVRELRFRLTRPARVRASLRVRGRQTRVLVLGTRQARTHRVRFRLPSGTRAATLLVRAGSRTVRLRVR